MPLAFYICAGIIALLLIFALAQITSRLYDIHIDLCHINEDLVRFYARGKLEGKPCKQRRKKDA